MTYGQVKAMQGEIKNRQKMYTSLMSQSLDPDAMLEAVINGTTIDIQDTLQNWLGALMDREEELKSMEKIKENERRQKLEDLKSLCNKENIQVFLSGLENVLAWMGYIENTVMKLPAEISDSRLLLLVKQSIKNKEELTAIKDSVSLKEIVAHVTIK